MLNDDIATQEDVIRALLARLDWGQANILAFGILSPETQRQVLEHPELLEIEIRNRGAIEEYVKEQKELEEFNNTFTKMMRW